MEFENGACEQNFTTKTISLNKTKKNIQIDFLPRKIKHVRFQWGVVHLITRYFLNSLLENVSKKLKGVNMISNNLPFKQRLTVN